MPDIYDQHRAAFARVSAYVVTHQGERVATIAFKFPKDGAGRLYAYVHWLGIPMVRGWAGGFGYDKSTAACSSAAKRALGSYPCAEAPHTTAVRAFWRALERDTGWHWDTQLANEGFTVLQAV